MAECWMFRSSLFFILLSVAIACQDSNPGKQQYEYISATNVVPLNIENTTYLSTFTMPLVLPSPIASDSSSILLYDHGQGRIKQFDSSGKVYAFNALGEGDNRLGCNYFLALGYFDESTLLIGCESKIKKFNLSNNSFENEIDSFEECPAFGGVLKEIFFLQLHGETLLISVNGTPCINIPREELPFTKSEFESIKFLRVKSLTTTIEKNTFNIPPDNPILEQELYHASTECHLSFNSINRRFYAMINPTNYLYEYDLNSDLEFQLTNTWKLNLPHTELPVEYILNNGHKADQGQLSMEHNFELRSIKAIDSLVIIAYRPSKPLDKTDKDYEDNQNKDFLAVVNLKSQETRVFSLDYRDIYYLATLDTGDMWFYNIGASELGGDSTIIHSLNASDVFKDKI